MVKKLSVLSDLDAFTEGGSHIGILEDMVNPENGKSERILVHKPRENFLKRPILIRSIVYEVKD